MSEPKRVDMDEVETREWLESLEAVIEREGPERAQFILETLIDKTRRTGGFIQ
jgi:pyruvate dehydrogenase E1 component